MGEGSGRTAENVMVQKLFGPFVRLIQSINFREII